MPVGDKVLDAAFEITMACRSFGYSTETPLAALKFGAMFKKAEHLKAKFALIIGEEEMANGILKIKNLQTQEQKEISLENLQEELDKVFHEGEHHHHDHCCEEH